MPRMGVVLALTVISTGPCLATLLWSFTSLAIDVELRAAAASQARAPKVGRT